MSGEKSVRNHPQNTSGGEVKEGGAPGIREDTYVQPMEETSVGKAFPTSGQRGSMLVQISTLQPMKYLIPEHVDIP